MIKHTGEDLPVSPTGTRPDGNGDSLNDHLSAQWLAEDAITVILDQTAHRQHRAEERERSLNCRSPT